MHSEGFQKPHWKEASELRAFLATRPGIDSPDARKPQSSLNGPPNLATLRDEPTTPLSISRPENMRGVPEEEIEATKVLAGELKGGWEGSDPVGHLNGFAGQRNNVLK